jgi:putative Holliday junction resolvase
MIIKLLVILLDSRLRYLIDFSYYMGRIMAIDYGRKRVGIAVTDLNRIIATPLDSVLAKDVFQFLNNYLKNEKVDIIVVGEPRQMNNELSESVKYIEPFYRKLKKDYPEIKVDKYDERFTSKIASQTIAMSGLRKKERQKKELIDKVSAVLILQSYMHAQQTMNN